MTIPPYALTLAHEINQARRKPIISDEELTPRPIPAFMAAQRAWYDRQLREAAGRGIRELTEGELEELGRCEWRWY